MTTTLALVPAEAPRDTLGQVLDGARLTVAAVIADWTEHGGPLQPAFDEALDDYERRLRGLG